MQFYHKNESLSENQSDMALDQQKFSINDIIAMDPEKIEGKIFELSLNKQK